MSKLEIQEHRYIVNGIKRDCRDLLRMLAEEVFEKAHMDLTRWKAEELKQIILKAADDIIIK